MPQLLTTALLVATFLSGIARGQEVQEPLRLAPPENASRLTPRPPPAETTDYYSDADAPSLAEAESSGDARQDAWTDENTGSREVIGSREEGASANPVPASLRVAPAEPGPAESLALLPQAAEETPVAPPQGGFTALFSVSASLAVVLGLFFLVAWLMKRGLPRSSGALPADVVQVLGRAPLAARQSVHLLRIGNKLLLVSATAAGVEPLTEITDPFEVDRLSGICQADHPNSSSNTFRQILGQLHARNKTDDGEGRA